MPDQSLSMLVMNPFADIHVHPQPDTRPIDVACVESIVVRCPVRGRGLLRRELSHGNDPELFRFFLRLVEHDGELELESDAPLVDALSRIGFLVAEDDIVDWPRFEVRLAATNELAEAPTRHDPGWVVSERFLFQPRFELHPDIRWPSDYDEQEGRLHCFGPGPAFWVGDAKAFVVPHWLRSEEAEFVSLMVPGQMPPALPPQLARALISAGAIVRRERPREAPLAALDNARARFSSARHARVRDLLPAAELLALRRYYRALLDAGLAPLGDRQHGGRFSLYNDPVGRFVQARLARMMSIVAGQPVAPTFSFFFSYVKSGMSLEPHRDRAQAEFSISLQLDYDPEPVSETGWPLGFSFDDGKSAYADLRIGDAVFYHGRELTHYRSALPAGHRSSHLVLEYVPHDFDGLLI